MPKGHYTTSTRHQWTPALVLEALADFVARLQRLPRPSEWQIAYGLPSYRIAERLYGSREAALASYLARCTEAEPAMAERRAPAWHFGQGRLTTAEDLRRRRHA